MDHPSARLGRRVLVADDDVGLCETVALALDAGGYEVTTVLDGGELLERLDAALSSPEEMPHVIITDVKMPTLSGLGVLTALRRARVVVPVIVVTGFADASVHMFAKRLGAVAVLKKPFDVDDLMAAVANALATSTLGGGPSATPHRGAA